MLNRATRANRVGPVSRTGRGRRKTVTALLAASAAVLAAGLGLALAPTAGSAAELSAQDILDEVTGGTALTGSGSAEIRLTTVNERGQERSNDLMFYRTETDSDGAKQLIEYLSPADVAGTKLLSIDEGGDAETQMWLYLPVLGRERRIAGSAAKDNFMGTDFTFEEIGGGTDFTDDYAPERLPDERVGDRNAYVLNLVPEDESESDYSYVKMWVWDEEFIPLRIEFYNERERLEKALVNDQLEQGDDGEWQPHEITMENVAEGTKTIIVLQEIDETEVPETYFTLRYLRR